MATTVNNPTESSGGTLGTRKTLIIMVTVVGCIAILWPKVFYPMMTGPGQTKPVIKDHRGPGIRQERPPHLRPETIHPAMRERGRAIPQVGSIHSDRPSSPPRIVEGRPGPIPGMRPPMGAGSHQPTKSANSMGFIMPLYTIGIVSFFIYTILKLVFKKTPPTPYPEIKPDPTFRNEVFTEPYIKRPESGNTKLAWKDHSAIVTAIHGLISAADEQLIKIDSIKKSANNLSKETEETDNAETADTITEPNGHIIKTPTEKPNSSQRPNSDDDASKVEKQLETGAVPKKRETSVDRGTMKVIPMEKKAKYETGRQQTSRPATPVQSVTLDATHHEADTAESKCILLDTPPVSKVVVADSDHSIETLDASHKHSEDAPVVLSGKMKLSLVKLDDNEKKSNDVIVTEVHKGAEKKKDSSQKTFSQNQE